MKRLGLFLVFLFLCQPAYANVHFESLPTNNTVASTIQVGGSITGNFISSNYLLSRIGYTPERTVKLLGDALYENRLIRDSIFAQTGRRFLRRDITSDYAQYRYLMDNALATREGLQLIPGVALTSAQVAALKSDIVWIEEQEVAGQKVLVPVVYIASTHDYRIEGGRIIAGDDINLLVDQLNNSGLLEAGRNLAVNANDGIVNHDGSIRAGKKLSLLAQNDIENISAEMAAKNITLVSSNGNIINRRYLETQSFAGGNDVKTVTGTAGSIIATGNLALNAGKTIAITGSKLMGGNISLNAKQVDIGTTVKTSHFNAAVSGVSLKQQSTTHLGSTVEGGNIAINTTGKTTVSGSRIHADKNLNIKAGKLDVLAVNDSSFEEDITTSKGFLSHQSTTTRHATSTNVGSSVSGGNVSLSTTKGDKVNGEAREGALGHIEVVGSDVSADNKLALKSAKNIDVRAGFDGAMKETHTKKSGWFSGGHLFSKSDDLEGRLNKTAVKSSLSGKDVSLTAGKDMALKGVDVTATQNLDGKAQNITVENTNNEEKTWSKHEKLTVGFGDLAKTVLNPLSAVSVKDGKASITLAKAEFSKADKVTTRTTVVGSNLQANNINLTAGSGGEGDDHQSDGHQGKVNPSGSEGDVHHPDDHQPDSQGDINITGLNLVARNEINLTAGNDVSIKEAKSTEKTAGKSMKGTAELKLTAKNEYVQIGYAVNEARKSEKNLKNAKQSYTRYRRELGKQRGKLIKLKADLANGKVGIEQADVDEMAGLIDDLKGDDAFYKANMALAAADLATKTLAVASQMAKAGSSPAYGFSASLELDIDALVKKFNTYAEQSVASNLNANNINIAANNTAMVRGSNLNARNAIDIAANDTNILASQDVSTSSNSSDHQHLNISYGTSGGLSGGVSADRSRGSSDGITNQNSRLNASNINITTKDRTAIAGANIAARDKLNIHTKHLEVASVQDSRNSRSNSQGFSVSGGESGISGMGANMGIRHSREKHTVLTTLTGNNVNIDVAKDTVLKGATIAATDSQGNDTGNLKLKTDTLEVSSLNNTRNSKSLSAGINAGIASQEQRDRADNSSTLSTVGIDFANDRSNSKTKTLGTIGKGRIEVASVDKSNTKLLNRDIKDNTVDIYNIKSHKGLKGSLDTRLLTKKGRAEIANDIKKFTSFVKKISAKAPKKYRGQIDLQRVAYERLRNGGLSEKQASLALQDPKLRSLLAVTDDIARLAKRHGGIRNVPDADLYALMKFTFGSTASSGKSVELSDGAGRSVRVMVVPEGGATPGLSGVLDALEIKQLQHFKQKLETTLNDYGKNAGGDVAKINTLAAVSVTAYLFFPTGVLDLPGLKAIKIVARGAKALRPLKNLSGKADEAARLARNQQYGAKVADKDGVEINVAPAKRNSDTIILGKTKNPNYADVAKENGYRNFDVPKKVWDNMTDTQRWKANKKFLDRTISKNDKILLSHNPNDPRVYTGYFKKEMEYLKGKGYKVSKDGTYMEPPK